MPSITFPGGHVLQVTSVQARALVDARLIRLGPTGSGFGVDREAVTRWLDDHVEVAGCDLCTSTVPAAVAFEARDASFDSGRNSVGGWAACEACAALVRAGDRDALLRHSIGVLAAVLPLARADLSAAVSGAHAVFWQARTGAERPLTR